LVTKAFVINRKFKKWVAEVVALNQMDVKAMAVAVQEAVIV
jgi:hypothetical protein